MDRTLRLPLKPTTEQKELLLETMRQFTRSFNAVCAEGWRLKDGNAYTLHRLTYRDCKALCPALVSDLHVQARQKAAEAVRSAVALERKGHPVSRPQSALCPPRYNVNSFRLNRDKGTVNLATVAGRQHVRFDIPPYAADWLSEDDWKVCTADLVYRKGRFVLHVVFQFPGLAFEDRGEALGLDLGVTRPAVTSDGRLHGQRRWREVSKRRFRLKRKLQSKGTKSAKRHLRLLAGRERRFRRDCDHALSKSILDGIAPGTAVVVENLTNIRQRVRASRGEAKRRLHSWSFAQLRALLDYKAEQKGCRVVGVDPRHTSQRCSRCGFIYRGNRPSQSRFVCRSCGHRANADRNAALNIRDRHLVGWSSPPGGPPSDDLSSQPSVPATLPLPGVNAVRAAG